MRWFHLLAGVVCLGLLVAVGLIAAEPQARSPRYLEDDVQYLPVSPTPQRPGKATDEHDPVLGDLLFNDVVSVYFSGPSLPKNPDGSLGGLAAGDDGTQMRIYQRFIVKDASDPEGRIYRTLYAYETLGKVEQRLAPPKADAKH